MLKSCGLVGSSGQVVQGDIKKVCQLNCGQKIRDSSALLIPAVGGIGNSNLSGGIFLIEACLFAACSKAGGKICLHGCFSFFAGMFRRLRAARYFLPGQKVPKEPPGDGANRISAARRLILHVPHPWTPFTGAQLGNRADKRKGAGGVSIDLISISAAAQLLVTFQWCFDGRNSAPFGICGAQAARWVCVPVPRPGALALTMEARK